MCLTSRDQTTYQNYCCIWIYNCCLFYVIIISARYINLFLLYPTKHSLEYEINNINISFVTNNIPYAFVFDTIRFELVFQKNMEKTRLGNPILFVPIKNLRLM